MTPFLIGNTTDHKREFRIWGGFGGTKEENHGFYVRTGEQFSVLIKFRSPLDTLRNVV